MPAHDLMEVLRRLHDEAEVVLAGAEGSGVTSRGTSAFGRAAGSARSCLLGSIPRAGQRHETPCVNPPPSAGGRSCRVEPGHRGPGRASSAREL
jgi:hypothetical protein